MMIGIGTPRSQSTIPRPMGLSFQPTFPRCIIADARVLFLSGAPGKPCASKAAPSPRRIDLSGPATGGYPECGRSPLIMDAPPLPRSPSSPQVRLPLISAAKLRRCGWQLWVKRGPFAMNPEHVGFLARSGLVGQAGRQVIRMTLARHAMDEIPMIG
jgi:hypothetical protein